MRKYLRILIWVCCICCIPVISVSAKEQELTVHATASSFWSSWYSSNNPSKAVDGDDNTYWQGARYKPYWWIQFDAGDIQTISSIYIKWYSVTYNVPEDYDIQVSKDAITWETVHASLTAYQQDLETVKIIDRKARYVRIYIRSVYPSTSSSVTPQVRECTVYKDFQIPKEEL